MEEAKTTAPRPAAGSGRRWSDITRPRAFQNAAYRRLWYASAVLAFGFWMERLAVGWFVLETTGSVFLTALSFAVRSAPSLLFAPLGGATADRVDRRKILVVTPLASAAVAASIAVVVAVGIDTAWPVLVAVAIGGITHNFEMPARVALISDLVGPRDAMNGIALHSVGTRAVGLFGALTGGVVIATVGPTVVFSVGAALFLIGAAVMRTVPSPVQKPRRDSGSLLGSAIEGLRFMASLPAVATLLVLAIVVEIFAFSFQALLPSVAKDVLNVGALGLGALTAMAGVGALLGALALTAAGDVRRKGLLILAVALLYGVAILGLGASSLFAVSLVVLVMVGVMAATFDTLQWTLLQAGVPDSMRGRALGGWVLAIGFGWVGHLEVGALGEALGVQNALLINGAVVAVVAMVALVVARRLRAS